MANHLHRSKANVLSDSARNRFSREQINIIEYTDLTEEQERDMFQRVQLGMSLSPAEKVSNPLLCSGLGKILKDRPVAALRSSGTMA